jgi:hypothetical protein
MEKIFIAIWQHPTYTPSTGLISEVQVNIHEGFSPEEILEINNVQNSIWKGEDIILIPISEDLINKIKNL